MTNVDEDPKPPYLVVRDGYSALEAHQSISSKPTFQTMSFEELRLRHYHKMRHESMSNPTAASTWRLSALDLKSLPLRPIRALLDVTRRYARAALTHEKHS